MKLVDGDFKDARDKVLTKQVVVLDTVNTWLYQLGLVYKVVPEVRKVYTDGHEQQAAARTSFCKNMVDHHRRFMSWTCFELNPKSGELESREVPPLEQLKGIDGKGKWVSEDGKKTKTFLTRKIISSGLFRDLFIVPDLN